MSIEVEERDLQPAAITANEFIDQALNERIQAIETCFDADALCIVAGLIGGVDDYARDLIEERKREEGSRDRLVVIITTNGGYIEIVQRIVDTIRHHYDHVDYVIPNYAYSAGTVLVLSGDEIYMDYYSRLGPIDPQIENNRGQQVPALGYLKQWDRLLKKANEGTITIAEVQLMIDGFDQAELYQYEHARELSVTLIREWLANYKFKNWQRTEGRNKPVTPEMRRRRAAKIARQLNETDKWHSHGHGISREVLESELQLQVNDLDSDPNRSRCVKAYYGLLEDYMGRRGHAAILHTRCRYLPLLSRHPE